MESGTQLGKAMGQTQGSGEVTESLHLVHSPKTRTSRVARTARQPWPGHSIRAERVSLQQDLIFPLPAYRCPPSLLAMLRISTSTHTWQTLPPDLLFQPQTIPVSKDSQVHHEEQVSEGREN